MTPTPYGDKAHNYLRAGWRGVLWLRPTTKWPPPKGYTGWEGAWPSPADVQAWTEEHADANIALRMPEDVLGVDVDAYEGKIGGKSLEELETELEPLPLTVMSTSRADAVSGIRFFRCPPASRWPNQAGSHIELIHYGHRYAVVWPSTHPEGGTYRWIDQRTGEMLTVPPRPEDLPELPHKWVDYLQANANTHTPKSDVDNQQVTDWLEALRPGEPCPKVAAAHQTTTNALQDGRQARHDTMVSGTSSLVGLGAWGHAGVAGALTQLRAEFLEQSTQPGVGQRTHDQAVAEWRRSIAGAIAMHHEERPAPAQMCSCPLPAFDPNIERDFWEARPSLGHLRTFARSRRTSPWSVLAIALVRMTVAIPPAYVLPAIIGGHASINLFVGIVARSGGGKGASEAAASDAIDVGDIHSSGVGSGEGILHQYVRYVPPNKKTGEDGYVDQHNDAVLFTASEVDTLGALHQRQSSTLLSELRKVYMGEELSFAYVDPTKRLKVEKHTYRAGLVVGVQPSRAAVLLDDADGGTPQRFLWVPGTDADMPDVAPDEPEPLQWNRPKSQFSEAGRIVIPVCQVAVDTIDGEHVKRNRGDGDALDGHALLTRLKWAAALGFLDGRVEVSEDDWHLAGVVMDLSTHTRGLIVQELNERKQSSNDARGLADAHREVIKEETVTEAGIRRVAQALKAKLEDGQDWSKSNLRKTLASRDRGYFDAAIDRLISAGDIVPHEHSNGTSYSYAGRVA